MKEANKGIDNSPFNKLRVKHLSTKKLSYNDFRGYKQRVIVKLRK